MSEETHPNAAVSPAAGPQVVWTYRLVAAGFVVLGLLVCRTAVRLSYYTPLGPGPGFFPLWAGGLLALFGAIILVQSFRAALILETDAIAPPRGTRVPLLVTIGAIAFFGFGIERLGFAITIFCLLMVLLVVYRCRVFPTALLVALGGSLGVGYAFTRFLGVYLPPAPGGLLRFIGL